MIETYVYSGLWWLPTDEDTKLSGQLTVERGKAKLEVLYSFGNEVLESNEGETAYAPFPAGQRRILGVTTDGKAVTLEACTAGPSTMKFPGIPTTTYRPSVVLIGAWFSEGEEVSFNEIAIRTSELDTWASVSGFTTSITPRTLPSGFVTATAFDIHFEPPDEISIPLDDGEEAKLIFNYEHRGLSPVTTEVGMTQSASLHLRFASAANLERVFEATAQLRNFLSLAVGQPLTVFAVTGFYDEVRTAANTPESIRILWEIPHNPERRRRALHPEEMLFRLPQAQPNISDVMKAWFSRQAVLRPVFRLYFGTLYHPDLFLDQRFIGYVQAVETYDRRRREATDLPNDEHRRRITAIVNAVPGQYREWLKNKLRWSNELVLRRRLTDVVHQCPDVCRRLIGTDDEIKAFVRTVVDTRNYHTHYDPSLEQNAVKGADLYRLVVQLRGVIEMSLLKELGFPCDAIDRTLDRVQRYAEVHSIRPAFPNEQEASEENIDSDADST